MSNSYTIDIAENGVIVQIYQSSLADGFTNTQYVFSNLENALDFIKTKEDRQNQVISLDDNSNGHFNFNPR